MKELAHLIFLVTLIGCSNSENEILSSNKTISAIFDEQEARDLATIIDFFDEKVCANEGLDANDLSVCYQSFFKRMEKGVVTNTIEVGISFHDQKRLYGSIDDSTFANIWYIGRSWKRGSGDTLKYLGLRYDGKYALFLKTMSEEYGVIDYYNEAFESSLSISPAMAESLLMHSEHYDVSDVRVRLIVAIHYLTLNDRRERDEKY